MPDSISTALPESKDERISALPDSIIHHILSFLPSTKQAIRTSVLSKRWENQWTHVPVLIFDSTGMSSINFLQFVDNALIFNECSKIKKFDLKYHFTGDEFPHHFFATKILFATKKHVEELNLRSGIQGYFSLPKVLFNYASLVKLRIEYCNVMPNGKVNWGCLTALDMRYCSLPEQAMEHILFGSPLLKSLQLRDCYGFRKLVIVSKSLKRLVLLNLHNIPKLSALEISCPDLKELSLRSITINNRELISRAIEKVLSASSLLESIELIHCDLWGKLSIVSKSLKRLVFRQPCSNSFDIEISCPNLAQLKLQTTRIYSLVLGL